MYMYMYTFVHMHMYIYIYVYIYIYMYEPSLGPGLGVQVAYGVTCVPVSDIDQPRRSPGDFRKLEGQMKKILGPY